LITIGSRWCMFAHAIWAYWLEDSPRKT
jgi:hypothetical protein